MPYTDYDPSPGSGQSPPWHYLLGYVNTNVGYSTDTLTLDAAAGFTWQESDAPQFPFSTVGAIVMIFPGVPGGAPVWSTVTGLSSSTVATISNSAASAHTGLQVIVFREINGNDSDNAMLTHVSRFEASLTTRPTMQFTTYSAPGTLVPQPGQAVLIQVESDTSPGVMIDVFGGSIDQVIISDIPGRDGENTTQCQCVSYDQICTRRLLMLTGLPAGDTTDSFTGDGVTTSFPLSKEPTALVSITVNGIAQTFGLYGATGVQWWWGLDILVCNQAGGSPLTSAQTLAINYSSVGGQVQAPSYSNMAASDVAAALVALLSAEGLSFSGSAGSPIVDFIQFTTQDTIGSALDSLITYISNGTTNYWWYVDPRRVVYFVEQGGPAAPWNLEVGDGSIGTALAQITNTITREKLANAAFVEITNALGSSTLPDRFIGDGSTRTFQTVYPIGAAPTLTLYLAGSFPTGGVVQTVGLQGTTGSQWYWTPGSTSLTQDTGGTVLGATDVLDVQYTPQLALTQSYIDTTATADRAAVEGGTGEYDVYDKISDSLPFVIVQGLNLATTLAEYFKALSQKVTITTFRPGLASGQSITINYPPCQASGSYVVDHVIMTNQDGIALWTVECVAGAVIGDWKTAFKALSSGQSSLTGFGAAGGGGGGAAVIPTALSFTPALYEYGTVTVENVLLTTAAPVTGVDWDVAYVDELNSDPALGCWSTAPAIDGSTDPVMIAVTPNGSQTSPLSFVLGDYILANDVGQYEILQLVAKAGNNWTLARAQLGSTIHSHSSGIKLYKVQTRRFPWNAPAGQGIGQGVPTRFDFSLPNACVLALAGSPYTTGGYGDQVLVNTAISTVPGLRTLMGDTYVMPAISGVLAAASGTNAVLSFYVQYASSLRLMLARVTVAPTGASIKINMQRSADGGTTWAVLQQLVITAGDFSNYQGLTPTPGDSRIPYGLTWPIAVLSPNDFLNFSIEQVGSSAHGSNLSVEIYT